MLIDPPIDKLVETVGNKYALVGLLSKRSRTIMEKRHDYLEIGRASCMERVYI